MSRLFVAVWPPDDVVEQLAALPRKDQRGVRFVPPENWHITLRFVGEANPDQVIASVDDAVMPTSIAHIGPGVDLLSDRAVVLPVSGLDPLAAAVRATTEHLGEPPRRRFVGHLTLARLKPHADMPRALGAFMRAEFEVREVALVQSRLDPDGARYSTIHTWPVG